MSFVLTISAESEGWKCRLDVVRIGDDVVTVVVRAMELFEALKTAACISLQTREGEVLLKRTRLFR